MLKYAEPKMHRQQSDPYSQESSAADLHFLRQIPLSRTGEVVGTTIEEQTEQVMLKAIKALLNSQNADFTDVVKQPASL